MIIKYDDAESAIQELNKQKEYYYYWDGWTICRFKAAPAAIYDKGGIYNEALGWGFITKFDADHDGLWHIDS